MATITLQTSRVTLDPGAPRIITFQFKRPFVAPVFLSVLTLVENPGLASIVGAIVPGSDPNHPGTCDLQMPTILLNPIWDFALTHSKPNVTITYNDTTFNVTQVSLSAGPAALVSPARHGDSPADAE
ncbi:MAG: hypothetical protein WDO74_14670 [Pseudomonadota bacterium]